jgi:hypothetical protein
MSRTALRLGTAALSVATVSGIGSTAAVGATPAANPASLSTVQAGAATAITLRVNDLNAAIAKATSVEQFGSSGSTLISYLQADITPLQALNTKIASDTNVSLAQADAATIFTKYRVLALVLPAAHLKGIADGIDVTVIPTLRRFLAKATSYVSPSTQAALLPLVDDMTTQIEAAAAAAAGVATTVLAYTPTQWNSDHDLLSPSRGAVQASERNTVTARSDAAEIRSILKTAKASPKTTPTTAT